VRTRDKLRIGARILASRGTGRPRPFFVQYSLLNACNAKCAYCDSPNRHGVQLSTAEHEGVLRELARLGAVRIKFLGGEPLLRDDVRQLVAEVRRLGMRSAMVTNGFLIPERFDVVRQVDELIVSIDGREDTHDAQRGRGTWKQVMRGIETCAREKIDFFLSAVVTESSARDIDWLIELARRLGVSVNFQIPQFNLEMYGPGARPLLPDPAAVRAILDRIIAAKDAGAPVLFTSESYPHPRGWAHFSRERIERPGEISPCSAGRYFLQIEPNGDLYPCVLHVGSFTPKNVLRAGVEAAWAHAQTHSCFDCYNTWLNENRAIFDLRPAVTANFWRNSLRPRAPRAEGPRFS
jgi:MoaA/NifB/PqqE/SkfB family radical SAM enzyme